MGVFYKQGPRGRFFMNNGISVLMAIIDFIPVLLFFTATIILQKDFYDKMVKGAYSLLAAGSIMVLLGGFFKVTWKILYALEICDFTVLNKSLFVIQGPGFFLVFCSLLSVLLRNGLEIKKTTALAAVVPVYSSNLLFFVVMILGSSGVLTCLFTLCGKLKKRSAQICFVISVIFMLAMGYLESKFDDSSKMNWIAQLTNILNQGVLLLGTCLMHKAIKENKDFLCRTR